MKNWWRHNRKTVVICLGILAVLAFAFWYGGDGSHSWTVPQESETTTVSGEKSTAGGAENDENPGTGTAGSVKFSITCEDVLAHRDQLSEAAAAVIPEDGVMLPEMTVSIEEGETVFDVLQRVCREQGIHMEHSVTPGYGTVYIEGIGNLYEFDCGNRSGWHYRVNGEELNYGCSSAKLSDGDVVAWVYLCTE